MASPATGTCAACSKPTTLRCSGCRGAPEYAPGDVPEIFYCGRDCQLEHRPEHKSDCRRLNHRITLSRAAVILKAALLTYKAVVYDIDLTKIEKEDGILWLHQTLKKKASRVLFPFGLTDNKEHREAALLVNQCTTAMALLGRMTPKLLSGTVKSLEVVDIHVGKTNYVTKLHPAPLSTRVPHTIIRATLLPSPSSSSSPSSSKDGGSGSGSGGETWAIDTTGGQYGFKDLIVPFEKYIREKECRPAGQTTPYDATETKDLDFFATLPFLNESAIQRDDWDLERGGRHRFAEFVNEYINRDILKGSEESFAEKKLALETALRAHMLGYETRDTPA